MERPTVERLHELFLYPDNGLLYRRVDRASHVSGPLGTPDPATGYMGLTVDYHHCRVHQVVFAMTHGHWAHGEVDHINGDKTDNRPDNLRDASRSQNQHNRGRQKNSKSGLKGVHWNKQRRKWIATIMVDRKLHYLGLYDDPSDAHAAYSAAAVRLRGEFARTA